MGVVVVASLCLSGLQRGLITTAKGSAERSLVVALDPGSGGGLIKDMRCLLFYFIEKRECEIRGST